MEADGKKNLTGLVIQGAPKQLEHSAPVTSNNAIMPHVQIAETKQGLANGKNQDLKDLDQKNPYQMSIGSSTKKLKYQTNEMDSSLVVFERQNNSKLKQ